MPEKRSQILVLGSLARNTLLVPSKDAPREFERQEGWVGAPLLREMICQALVELPDDPKRTDDETTIQANQALERVRTSVRPDPPDPAQNDLQESLVKITTVFKQVSKTSDPKNRESVMRVVTQYTSRPRQSDDMRAALSAYMAKAMSKDRTGPDILVLFDFDEASRAAAAANLATLGPAAGARATVIGFSDEIDPKSLAWLESLSPEITGGRDQTVAVIRAEQLRKEGLIVVESGPIERTVRDLFPCFEHAPLKTVTKCAAHIVILFEEVGAVYVQMKEGVAGSFHLSSNLDWIAHEDGTRFGRTPGRMSITLAAIVRQIADGNRHDALPDLSPAIRLSIVAFNRHFTEGYDAKDPIATLASTLSYNSREHLKRLTVGGAGKKPDKAFFTTTLAFPMKLPEIDTWTRLDAVMRGDPDADARQLRQIVLEGAEAGFRRVPEASEGKWHPQARILCPYMQIGNLKTFDEDEIGGFTSLTKLFRKYLHTPAWKAPLSIAVFGPPGTGKSFAVRELMKNVNPAAEKELTFNLSQLTSVEALNDAFHDVQHRVLSSEEVPLVFFDEFDAMFSDNWLGWLRYFLAPMQDGVFRGKSTDYRIGRAFFVFAGGSSGSFTEFTQLLEGETETNARHAKLPDFVSRLQGYLDIQSINPPEKQGMDSPQKMRQRQIKRALLLRSLLLTHATPIIQKQGDEEVPKIDEHLIDAFLHAERYEHGLRSMESIVRMSKWVDGSFIPASLPAKWLLKMHVTGFRVKGPGGPFELC